MEYGDLLIKELEMDATTTGWGIARQF